MAKKTWQEKFNTRCEPELEVLQKDFGGMKAGQTMLISTPAEVEATIRAIPRGQQLSMVELRQKLADPHHADGCCPMTASIFTRIVAELSLEQGTDVPFWRVVDPKSPLAQKLSCGPEYIQAKRAEEGL